MEESLAADGPAPAEAPRLLTRRRGAGGALLAAACAIVAIVLLGSSGGKDGAPATGVPAGETTTEVTRRTLTESSTVDGTLGYGSTLELYDRLPGTFTWLPAVGAVVGRGGTLWRIDNTPVVLMYGSVPAYRALKEGIGDGPDVTELNQNLIDLGYDPYGAIADDEGFSAATAAAVRRWQHAEGLPETGKVELGRIVFAPNARRVTAVKVALGQDPPGEDASKKPATKKPTSKAPASKAPASKGPSSKEPASKEPASDGSNEPGASAGMAVLGTTSTKQIVTLKVKAEQQTLARVGESAPVTLPGGQVVQGRIAGVDTVAESKASEQGGEKGGNPSGGEGESPTISVTLALAHPVSRLDEAPVSVDLVKNVSHDVLTVPATALTATAGGGYAIETLRAGGRRVAIAVTPSMFANGYVQIEGPGVHEGLAVIESE